MSSIFIVVEQLYGSYGEYVPSSIFRDESAIRTHYEEWFEDEPHFCIGEDGIVYKLEYKAIQGCIKLSRQIELTLDIDLFIKLLDRYFQSLERSQDPKARSAAKYARSLLKEKRAASFKEFESMADALDFY
jgi:hypothetical protein